MTAKMIRVEKIYDDKGRFGGIFWGDGVDIGSFFDIFALYTKKHFLPEYFYTNTLLPSLCVTILSMDYIRNKKASFDYQYDDTIECGIELTGIEVKSVRHGHARVEGAHIIVRGGELYIVGMTIDPYQANNTKDDYDPLRTRKLLVHKKQLHDIETAEGKKGLTCIPIALYSKGAKIKISIAIAQGKKAYDKRETIKKRDSDREIRRELKAR
jgi:SsrA-binding protein